MGNEVVLAGSLEFLSLGDVLQLLGTNGSSGLLRLKSKYVQEPGEIHISGGNPINASNGGLSGLDAVNSLFGWITGEYEFFETNVNCETVIQKSRMSIILDALSMLDEGDIEKLGPVSFADSAEADGSGSPAAALPLLKGPLVDYMYVVDEEEFQPGQEIANEGKHGNWIWVILEGVVDILKASDQGPTKILTLGGGAFIGSLASFQIGGNVRSATAIAASKVQLGVLDSQRMASEFAQLSTPFKAMVNGLDKRLREGTDFAMAIKSGQNPVKGLMNEKKSVIKQGSPEDRVFEISKGEAVVVRKTGHGDIPLANLGPGNLFGRIPFLDIGQEPESASVYGSEDLKVKAIEIDGFRNEYDGLSTTFKNLLDHLVTSTNVTTRLACDFQKMGKSAPKTKS